MRIAVCIKQVPDPQAPEGSFYVDEATNEPCWSPPAESVISTFDLHAVEAAVQLKEQHGGHVVVLSLGPPDAERALRRALAAGADEAARIEADAAPDGNRMAVAAALAAAIRKVGDIDLVLCGRIAADWDMGHVPMMLAEMLDIPGASPVLGLNRASDRVLVAERLADDGHEIAELDLPCLLAVSNELNDPRYPTMRATIEAQRKPLPTWGKTELEMVKQPAAAATLRRLRGRDLTRPCEFIEGDSVEAAGRALAGLLQDRGLVTAGDRS